MGQMILNKQAKTKRKGLKETQYEKLNHSRCGFVSSFSIA